MKTLTFKWIAMLSFIAPDNSSGSQKKKHPSLPVCPSVSEMCIPTIRIGSHLLNYSITETN